MWKLLEDSFTDLGLYANPLCTIHTATSETYELNDSFKPEAINTTVT